MIARVHFNGVIEVKGKEWEYPDYCDIHVGALEDAERTFKFWIGKQFSIRGAKGIWHLNDGRSNKIEFVKVEKRPKERGD